MDKHRTRAERSLAPAENRENGQGKQQNKNFQKSAREQQPPEFDQATAQSEKAEVDKLPVDSEENNSILISKLLPRL